jgi:hypothetical protein
MKCIFASRKTATLTKSDTLNNFQERVYVNIFVLLIPSPQIIPWTAVLSYRVFWNVILKVIKVLKWKYPFSIFFFFVLVDFGLFWLEMLQGM